MGTAKTLKNKASKAAKKLARANLTEELNQTIKALATTTLGRREQELNVPNSLMLLTMQLS